MLCLEPSAEPRERPCPGVGGIGAGGIQASRSLPLPLWGHSFTPALIRYLETGLCILLVCCWFRAKALVRTSCDHGCGGSEAITFALHWFLVTANMCCLYSLIRIQTLVKLVPTLRRGLSDGVSGCLLALLGGSDVELRNSIIYPPARCRDGPCLGRRCGNACSFVWC